MQYICHKPNAPVQYLDMLGEEERTWLTPSCDLIESTYKQLHERFESMVEKYPENVAIQWQTRESFTYRKLDVLANRMGFHLLERGAKPGDLMPILLEKSPTMIITILAILKIGAAYVPLSPENPVERNIFIIREAKAGLVLTETAYKDYFTGYDIALEWLDLIDTSTCSAHKPDIEVDLDRLAYIIYTSGSTGQPKGVMIKHRAVATAIDSITSFEGRDSMECRTLQFSNYVFDASVYDIFVPLSCGHTLCMAPTDRLLSELTNVINEMNVSHCFLTPTVARLLDPKTVPSLKVLTIGGEAVTPDVCEIWSNDHTLFIAYGPTETSIMVTMTKFDPNEGPRNIGRPFSSANAFVLDPNSLRLLPWGVVGELCICGPQLAEGYLERPKQTEAAFVDFSTENIFRIYRT